MTIRTVFFAAALAGAAGLAAPAADAAVLQYVGSWRVDDGPQWGLGPLAYTGQEAAALLFGGSAADYVISTVSALVAEIDRLTWISTWDSTDICGGAFPCGTKVADDFKVSTGGFYLNPGDTSAYVTDWAVGPQFVNYAFRVGDDIPPIPLPHGLPLAAGALVLLALVARRRRDEGPSA
jgi:hypothetical protein